jgi:hypothetical protein
MHDEKTLCHEQNEATKQDSEVILGAFGVTLDTRGRFKRGTADIARSAMFYERGYISCEVLWTANLISWQIKFLLFLTYEAGVLDHNRTSRTCPPAEHCRYRRCCFIAQPHLLREHTERIAFFVNLSSFAPS